MIKINLLRDSGSTGVAAQSANISSGYGLPPGEFRDFVIKGFLVILPLTLFYLIKGYHQIVLNNELTQVKAQLSDTDSKLQALDPAVKEMERFQIEKRKLDSQLDVIKRLSKERLKNVKSLDALQSIIPQKAWLSSLKILENKVEISGFATDDIIVSEFMQSLEASIYFANVSLISSEEFKGPAGVVKQFQLKCILENL